MQKSSILLVMIIPSVIIQGILLAFSYHQLPNSNNRNLESPAGDPSIKIDFFLILDDCFDFSRFFRFLSISPFGHLGRLCRYCFWIMSILSDFIGLGQLYKFWSIMSILGNLVNYGQLCRFWGI